MQCLHFRKGYFQCRVQLVPHGVARVVFFDERGVRLGCALGVDERLGAGLHAGVCPAGYRRQHRAAVAGALLGLTPIALDLVLFSDLAMRAGMCGIQTWLSFFCKSPMHDFEHQPEHDLFTQWRMVKQTLRNMIGEKEPDYLA